MYGKTLVPSVILGVILLAFGTAAQEVAPAGIQEGDLIDGASVATAENLFGAIDAGAAVFSY